jgi:glycosyltransferase involved in cell wall biosynthesis
MAESSPAPLISIIMATYNRSDVLRLAVETARRQTVRDWELLVVGDACTDDTAEVVASFNDPRIRFFNLPRNVGEQSGPNTEGMRRARGRYLAFLNHDDLWLPDHLEVALAGIEETGADLVYTVQLVIQGPGQRRLDGLTPSHRYEPRSSVAASCWLFRRELRERVGGWRFYQECHRVPSQDWLYRAWRGGCDLRLVPQLTVVSLPSGFRRNSYAAPTADEHRHYYERIRTEPGFRGKELAPFVTEWDSRWLLYLPPALLLRRALMNAAMRLLLRCGIDFASVTALRDGKRRGADLDQLREVRGLPRLERRGKRLLEKLFG